VAVFDLAQTTGGSGNAHSPQEFNDGKNEDQKEQSNNYRACWVHTPRPPQLNKRRAAAAYSVLDGGASATFFSRGPVPILIAPL